MPTQSGAFDDIISHSSRGHVLYSCQYEQLLYGRQRVNGRQEALPSLWIDPNQDFVSSEYSKKGIDSMTASCRLANSKKNSDVVMQDMETLPQTRPEYRNRKFRQRRYRGTSSIGERIFRYKQRYQFMTSEQCRRRRFPSMAQRKAANVREQRRMFNLKEAFKSLRECLPTFSYEKKMSRIETLKLAIAYIGFLRKLLDDSEQDTLKVISKNQSETGREC